MRKKIDFKISQGTPKHIAIAQGWKEHNKNKPLNTDKNQPSINTTDDKLINNRYYRAKNGLPIED